MTGLRGPEGESLAYDPERDEVDYWANGRRAAPHDTTADDAAALDELHDQEDADEDDLYPSWDPVDLGPALEGKKTRPEPSLLRRSDGECLLYPGQVNYLHGTDGIGKSFVAVVAAKQELEAGHHVVWLDWEDPDETTIIGRLRDLGVDTAAISDRLHYIHPHEEATPTAVAKIVRLIRDTEATLVVLDSVGEAFSVDGVDENADVQVAPWMRRVLRPLAEAGAAVFPIDHATNANDDPTRPSGSKRKRASVTGHAMYVEVIDALNRETGGKLRLMCGKDRHGSYRRRDAVAEVEFTKYPDGGMTVHVWPPFDKGQTSTLDLVAARAAVRAVKSLSEDGLTPASMATVETRMTFRGRAAAKRAGVEVAVAKGALSETRGPRNARLISYVRDLEEA